MSIKNFNSIKIVMFIVLLLIAPNLQAYFSNNKSECAFEGSCPPPDESASISSADRIASCGLTLGQLIAKGGEEFLKSASDINSLLSIVEGSEVSGMDTPALNTALNSAIDNLEKARNTYYDIIWYTYYTPYNEAVISQLVSFDYTGYRKVNGLDRNTFINVQAYLGNGDVRGTYYKFYYDCDDLLSRLNTVKADINDGKPPEQYLSKLWRLSDYLTNCKRFSQYVAEVFYAL
jgi:hypothetical protein